MKSPKFYLRERELEAVINADRLKFTWTSKLRAAMRAQYVPDPLDYLDVHASIDRISKELTAEIFKGRYSPSSPNRYLSEKSKGLCRQMVIPNVRDALVLQCLSGALWHDLKGKAPTPNSYFEPQESAFPRSKAHEYGPFRAWLRFQERIFRFSKERNFIIVTDVANYYDFIRYDHLRNTISNISDVRESVLDFLIFLLSELLWQPDYMPRVEIGLPQLNFDAPRILAHCFLYELDKVVCSFPDTDYVRFMDDIDIGVDSIEAAKRIIRDIDLTLQSRHVRLNSGKTIILSSSAARQHFKVRENALLDSLENQLKSATGVLKAKIRRKLPSVVRWAYRAGRFNDGNGDKILKRCIRIAAELKFDLGREIIEYVLYRRPSCRTALFRWFCQMPFNIQRFKVFSSFALSEHVVDDACIVEFSKALVDVRVKGSASEAALIVACALRLKDKNYYGPFAALWILSKYGTPEQVLNLVREYAEGTLRDDMLGRLVGGVAPRFAATLLRNEYTQIVFRTQNRAAIDAMTFHYQLSTDVAFVNTVSAVVSAPSTSHPNEITHSKFLSLMSICNSSSHKRELVDRIRKRHIAYKEDGFYARLIP